MNPHVKSALWSGVITVIVALGPVAVMDTAVSGRWLDELFTAPIWPAFNLATSLGVKGGPDGLPGLPYVYALTFLVWWAVIDLSLVLWRWGRSQ